MQSTPWLRMAGEFSAWTILLQFVSVTSTLRLTDQAHATS